MCRNLIRTACCKKRKQTLETPNLSLFTFSSKLTVSQITYFASEYPECKDGVAENRRNGDGCTD
jgi:hypothetical protein